MAVAVNNLVITDNSFIVTPMSVGVVYFVSSIFCVILVAISFFMGVFAFERSKHGFSEQLLGKTITYEENLISDAEITEVEEYTGDSNSNHFLKLLSLFTLEVMY